MRLILYLLIVILFHLWYSRTHYSGIMNYRNTRIRNRDDETKEKTYILIQELQNELQAFKSHLLTKYPENKTVQRLRRWDGEIEEIHHNF